MSRTIPNRESRQLRSNAALFAALGDETRITLLLKLGDGSLVSITQLTDGLPVSRQAVTKHLRILNEAGLVRNMRRGRESLFQIDPKPIDDAREALNRISELWDQSLSRLKEFVEN